MELTEVQKEAILSHHKDTCVVAGAGTGKTTVLVEKFIHLVTGNKDIGMDEVLAITFTDKAAVEMKQKVLDRLSLIGSADLKRQAESAYISTIHAFCTRVLRENPVEADVDPTFEVMDEVASAAYMEQALEAFFEEPPVGLHELLQLYEESFVTQVINSALKRYRSMGYSANNLMLLPDSISRLEKIIAAKNRELSRLVADIKELAETLEEWHTVKTMEDKRRKIVSIASGLHTSSPDVNIIAAIRNLCSGARSKGPREANPEAHGRIASAMKEIKNRCDRRPWLLKSDEESEKEADGHRHWFQLAAHEVLKRYDSYKDELRALDFEDLQMKAIELFARHPHILERYRSKFKAVLVDEYQDINRLQAELVKTLTQNNKLFVVGDPKQSIYEFRDADLRQFIEFYNDVQEDARHSLDKSFRSRQEVLDFVNPFFRTLWTNPDFPYHPLHSEKGKHLPKEVPSVEIIVCPKGEGESLDEARLAEADAVVSKIETVVTLSTDELQKWGRKEPYAYSDFAVLFRSSAAIRIYEDAFKTRGIPYTVNKGSGFFESREFADALSLLQIIDNAQQDIPMAAVLRSPLVGINDDTLLTLQTSANKSKRHRCLSETIHRLSELEGLEPAEQKELEKFSDLLLGLRASRSRSAPDELLERAVTWTSYESKIASGEDGLQKLANIRKVVQFLRENRSRGAENLHNMCRFMETASRAGISEKEAPLEPEGSDAVSFITIHGAKGLEFPVVILADMGRDFRKGGKDKSVYVSEGYGICCKHHARDGQEAENLGYLFSREEQRERQDAEEKRLLYVAMTRAREHLILAGSGDINKEIDPKTATVPLLSVCSALKLTFPREQTNQTPSPKEEVIEYCQAKVKVTTVSERKRLTSPTIPSLPAQKYREEIASGQKIDLVQADEKVASAVARRLDCAERPLPEKRISLSVSGLLEYRQCPARYYFKYTLRLPEEETFLPQADDLRGGPLFGARVHALLTLMDFSRDLKEQLPSLFRAVGLPQNSHEEVLTLLRNFTGCNLYAELKGAVELHRELPFSLTLGGANLNGVMDLLFKRLDQQYALLDYKTDDVSGNDVATRGETYFFQLSLYALAVRETLGFSPHTVMLYFLRPNSVLGREMSEAQLSSTREEAVELIAKIRDEEHPLIKSPRCCSCAYGSSFCKILEGHSP